MIILDASAVVDVLLRANGIPEITSALAKAETIACPMILNLEILNVLRRLIREKRVTALRAKDALQLYWALPIERFGTELLANRIWALRHNFTAYDASYIALAELLHVPLYTRDTKWRGIGSHTAIIHFI